MSQVAVWRVNLKVAQSSHWRLDWDNSWRNGEERTDHGDVKKKKVELTRLGHLQLVGGGRVGKKDKGEEDP